MSLEHDHDLTKPELAVRLLGLVHMARLYDEIGHYDLELCEDLHHTAHILAEQIALEAY